MTINDIMLQLMADFGETYDVRLVPSVHLGGGHRCRAIISNIHIEGCRQSEFSATHGTSYQLALNRAYLMLQAEMGKTR